MSTPALILWIVVALLFVAAVYGVYRASRSTLRKTVALGREVGGLAAEFSERSTLGAEARASARREEVDHG